MITAPSGSGVGRRAGATGMHLGLERLCLEPTRHVVHP